MALCCTEGNCEEQLTSTDSRPTVGQQITNSFPTGQAMEKKCQLANCRLTVGEDELFFTITIFTEIRNKNNRSH